MILHLRKRRCSWHSLRTPARSLGRCCSRCCRCSDARTPPCSSPSRCSRGCTRRPRSWGYSARPRRSRARERWGRRPRWFAHLAARHRPRSRRQACAHRPQQRRTREHPPRPHREVVRRTQPSRVERPRLQRRWPCRRRARRPHSGPPPRRVRRPSRSRPASKTRATRARARQSTFVAAWSGATSTRSYHTVQATRENASSSACREQTLRTSAASSFRWRCRCGS
jgi:hypothetical protein